MEFSYVTPMTGGIYPTYCGMYPTQSAMTVPILFLFIANFQGHR